MWPCGLCVALCAYVRICAISMRVGIIGIMCNSFINWGSMFTCCAGGDTKRNCWLRYASSYRSSFTQMPCVRLEFCPSSNMTTLTSRKRMDWKSFDSSNPWRGPLRKGRSIRGTICTQLNSKFEGSFARGCRSRSQRLHGSRHPAFVFFG